MSPINSLWFKWKSLKLPWRKMFLVGSDLQGNTFWEFKDAINAGRFRRIVKSDPKTHYADVKVTPQWHQWLRYVRPNPPTIEEQKNEVLRQEQIKYLAKLADERWAKKPSYLDKPQEQQPGPVLQSHNPSYHAGSKDTKEPVGVHNAVGADSELKKQGLKKKEKNPWDRADGGPSEKWQPEPWNPTVSRK